ncbi:hypothetical protein IOD16_22805 [Saccharothrix sp. 6-C]|uniref:Ig-like domain-containing protein n=1 Tax=Saccharothrix texasensis TaxID=103734 RepID=A0A3N1HHS4_9PSEU|nr:MULTISPECIES: hypothetical protein [Saccharothrix]QQQ74053.1 hypothetical protein IOD16_22805 [Saccharothrix sp. 6-C]ROP42050.1 hypothetical protein EDD40_7541 [Saccharothrix texasensis]
MSRTGKSLRAVVVALGGAALLAAAPTASAAPTVQVLCETGGNAYFCDVLVSGAVGPTTINWAKNGSAMPASDNMSYVYQSCRGGTYLSLTATVTDSTGASADTFSFSCSSAPWP